MIGRSLIALFFFWHVAAIAIYTVPPEAQDSLSRRTKEELVPIVRPYLFITSQWQQWNLFSPDPLRRIVHYYIEQWNGREWETVAVLTPDSLPWWRDADELKILRRMEDAGERWVQLRKRYLEDFCVRRGFPEGTSLRMVYLSTVLPKLATPMPLAFWRTYVPQWNRSDAAVTVCPFFPT